MSTIESNLTGAEKASVLLMMLGTEMSAEALKHLSEQEIEMLAPEMVKGRRVDEQTQEAIIAEFEQMKGASLPTDAAAFAAQALERALGQEKAQQLIQQSAGSARRGRPFQGLSDTDAIRLAKLLKDEQPQLIALVLTNIHPDKAAAVMCLLDQEMQVEVAMRIASTTETNSRVLAEIEEVLKSSLAAGGQETQAPAGPDALVEILSRAERSTERLVMETMNERDSILGAEVRRKMFLFEDIVRLPDRAVQFILREIDQEQLRLALKGANEEIKDLLFRNMSERAAEALKEDIELLQNVRTKDIEAAQQQIGILVRRRLASGEIVIDEEEEAGEAGEESENVERSDQT